MSDSGILEREECMITIRVDKELKERTSVLFKNMGVPFTTAVKMFFIQCVKEDKIPFEANKKGNAKKEIYATTIRIDKELKDEVKSVFKYHNISFSAAVSLFLDQCIKENGFPFKINGSEIVRQ